MKINSNEIYQKQGLIHLVDDFIHTSQYVLCSN